eukprot:352468-Chlamydomonas_euryale.AAC.3
MSGACCNRASRRSRTRGTRRRTHASRASCVVRNARAGGDAPASYQTRTTPAAANLSWEDALIRGDFSHAPQRAGRLGIPGAAKPALRVPVASRLPSSSAPGDSGQPTRRS